METPVNPEEVDWSVTTFDGLRLQQMREFAALPFREKLLAVEELNELAERLQRGMKAAEQRGPRPAELNQGPEPGPPQNHGE
jgi:hypothetical protein